MIASKPAPATHVDLPTLRMSDWVRHRRWWHPDAEIPTRCTDCRGRIFNEPPQFERFGRVYCSMCSRTLAWISHVGWSL